jgi:hypothetical protein
MHAIPTIFQIIFYIAALLAPEDATKMTLSSTPNDSKQFTKTVMGTWVLPADATEWKVTGDFMVIRPTKAGGKEERLLVASVIEKTPNVAKSLLAHDWTMKPTRNLSGGLTIDKTADGFRIHAQKEEDSPVVDFRVVYSK